MEYGVSSKKRTVLTYCLPLTVFYNRESNDGYPSLLFAR